MTGYLLKVHVPDHTTFEAYYYGYGSVARVDRSDIRDGWLLYTIDYGLDLFHLQYQEGRFASGLYCATREEYRNEY